jgi:MHS family proline/betaine transporter-like MFS transporter
MNEPGAAAAKRNVLASTTGNVLEWYEFAVYGYFGPILAKLLFPSDDPVASPLVAFGVFAIGYAVRPIGGAIVGHIGDCFGRKPLLYFVSVCRHHVDSPTL